MNKAYQAALMLTSMMLISGCANLEGRTAGAAPMMRVAEADDFTGGRQQRMVAWKAHLTLEVWSVSNAVREAMAASERQGGFVEHKSDSGEKSADVTLRVPTKAFHAAITTLETLGTITYQDVQGEDVTEQYIDVDARLKNKIVLRDRLQKLLDKATDIKDVLAIETELNRVQADIDSMEARMKALKGQVEYATITLHLERKQILGPLGYVFKGLWWGVKKLFVIRD
jgi:hypothetical protein